MRSREKGLWDMYARLDRLMIAAAQDKLGPEYTVYTHGSRVG